MKHEEEALAATTAPQASLARQAPTEAGNATKQPAVQATKGPAPLSAH